MNLAPYTQTLTLYTPHPKPWPLPSDRGHMTPNMSLALGPCTPNPTRYLPHSRSAGGGDPGKIVRYEVYCSHVHQQVKQNEKKCKKQLCAMASIAPMSTNRSTVWDLGFGVCGLGFC